MPAIWGLAHIQRKGVQNWRKIFRKAAGSRTVKSSKVRTVHTVARVILENKGQILSLLSKPSNGFLLHSVVLTRNVPVLGILYLLFSVWKALPQVKAQLPPSFPSGSHQKTLSPILHI